MILYRIVPFGSRITSIRNEWANLIKYYVSVIKVKLKSTLLKNAKFDDEYDCRDMSSFVYKQ